VGHNSRTYTNLLLGLSVADLITSIAYFLSTWPIPKDTIDTDYIWYNVGTQTTCNIQGLMFQIGTLGSLMYTCSLSLHFLLSIRYKWLPSRVKELDPFIHAESILIPVGTGILGWIATVYNPVILGCYTQGYPSGCLKIGAPKCIRGQQTRMYMLFMIVFPILLAFMFISTAMTLIYLTVYNQDQRMTRYQYGANNSNRMTRQTFWMACQYVGAFCVSFIPFALMYVVKIITDGDAPIFYLLFWQALFSPLQGFLNAVVYSNDLRSHLHLVGQTIAFSLRNMRGGNPERSNENSVEREESEIRPIVSVDIADQENSDHEEMINYIENHIAAFEDDSASVEREDNDTSPMLATLEMHELNDIIINQDAQELDKPASD